MRHATITLCIIVAIFACPCARGQRNGDLSREDRLRVGSIASKAGTDAGRKYLLETPPDNLAPCGHQRAAYDAARKSLSDAHHDPKLVPEIFLIDLNMCEDMVTDQGSAFALRIQRSEQSAALHQEKLRQHETKP